MSSSSPKELAHLFFDSDPPKTLEGRDFNVRADGALVFTKEYLIARGTCCGSKCRNCPYENRRTKLDDAKIDLRPVISMVPSWTETLIACGVNVQGRTRFCIHPKDLAKSIPVFGGTKTLADDASEKLEILLKSSSGQKPIVVLDREENPKSFFEFFSKFDCEIVVTHVENGVTFLRDLTLLAKALAPEPVATELIKLHERWIQANQPRPSKMPVGSESVFTDLILNTDCPILYVIWRNPWMVVRFDTWIGEMLRAKFPTAKYPLDGKRIFAGPAESKYPEIIALDVPDGAVILFSSEPYPFAAASDLNASDLALNSRAIAVVNGEAFSWFGLRALRFLEES